MTRVDPVLFGWSYDFVGDLAETTALIWPERPSERHWPDLKEVIETLHSAPKATLPGILAGWLDTLDATGRWALLKLVTGALARRRLGPAREDGRGRVRQARRRRDRGGLARARAALCQPVRLARREGRTALARRPALVPAAHAGASAGGRGSRQNGRRAKGLGGGVEVGRHPRADRQHRCTTCASTRAPATRSRAPFPTSRPRWRSGPWSTASCWSAGTAGPPASTSCSSASTARRRRPPCSRITRPSCGSTTC